MIKASDDRVRNRVLERFRLGLKTKAPIGSGSFTHGAIMLVGEQTSHPEQNKYHAPFCSTKGCSGWLNARLEEAEIPEEYLYWVNALDNDGSEVDLKALVDVLKPAYVIALGNVAKTQLEKQQVSFRHVAHPQYWKRFKHSEPYPLIEMLGFLICCLSII